MTQAAQPREQSSQSAQAVWLTLTFVGLYIAIALCCLRHWNSPHPWARLDVFSGGYLLASLLWALPALRFAGTIYRSPEVMREASGAIFDPAMFKWINIFAIGELSAFLDYGHWHLVPQLEIRALQALGLVLYIAGAFWLIWTDRHLMAQFRGDLSERKLVETGPYRWVRHPRYAALVLSRIAFALNLASILAWIFVVGWLWVIVRRVRLEETHLHEIFGAEYDAYAKLTARLLPGIY